MASDGLAGCVDHYRDRAIFPAVRYYRYFQSHVSTDDAYVDGTVALVSSGIPGTVAKLT